MLGFQERVYTLGLHIDRHKQTIQLSTSCEKVEPLTSKFLNLFSFLLSLYN